MAVIPAPNKPHFELRLTRMVAYPAAALGLLAALLVVFVYPVGWAGPYGAPVGFLVFHGMFWTAVAADYWRHRKHR